MREKEGETACKEEDKWREEIISKERQGFCQCNQPSENDWLVFSRLPPSGEAVCSSGSSSPTLTAKGTGDISAHIGTSPSFCFFSPSFSVLTVLDMVFQEAVLSILQGNWFPAWALLLVSGAMAARHCLWPWGQPLGGAGLTLPPQLPNASDPQPALA